MNLRPWQIGLSPWERGLLAERRPPGSASREWRTVGRVIVLDRVEVATGARVTRQTDAQIAGHIPVRLRRYYSTSALEGSVGALSRGWRHSFEHALTTVDGRASFVAADGSVLDFAIAPSSDSAHAPTPAIQGGAELSMEGGCCVVYRWDHLHTRFRQYAFDRTAGDTWRLVAIENAARQRLSLDYDDRGRLQTVEQVIERRRLHFDYDGRNRLAKSFLRTPRCPDGILLAEYFYDEAGNMSRVAGPRLRPAEYRYDEAGRLALESGPSWRLASAYDVDGRCASLTIDDASPFRRFEYAPNGVTRVIDSLDREALYESTKSPRGPEVTLAIAPCGSQTQLEFDEWGRPTALIGSRGDRTSYAYDDRGDLVRLTTADGGAFELSHQADHQPAAIRDAAGGHWKMQHHLGALASIIDPLGGETVFDRAADNVIQGARTTGHKIAIEHDPDWYQVTSRNAAGVITSERYDHFLDVVEPTVEIELDDRAKRESGPVPRRISCEEAGHDYVWDSEGRLIQLRLPSGVVHTFDYDAEDRLISRQSTAEGEYQLVRPPDGRLVELVRPDATSVVFHFDSSGRMIRATLAGEEIARQAFDQAGQLVDVAVAGTARRIERDILGRPVALIGQDAREEIQYDAAGNITVVSSGPAGGLELRLEYDPRGRLIALGDRGGVRQSFEYGIRGLLVRRQLGAIDEVWTHDSSGRLVAYNLGTTIADRFEYNREGKLKAVLDAQRRRTEVTPAGPAQVVPRRCHSDALEAVVVSTMSIGATRSPGWFAIDDTIGLTLGPDGISIGHADSGPQISVQRSGSGQTWACVSTTGRPRALWIDGACYHAVTSSHAPILELLDGGANIVGRGEFDLAGNLVHSEGLTAGAVPQPIFLGSADLDPQRQTRRTRTPIERLDDEIIGI